MTIKCFFDLLSTLLTPAIAVITVLILVFQYKLAKQQWKLSLYDKRYSVFLTTMSFISNILIDAPVSKEDLLKFARESKEREFLFGDDVQKLLNEIHEKASSLRTTREASDKLPEGDERTELKTREGELHDWFNKQFDISKKIFRSYLLIKEK
ncbi:MAG: hypothetical protein ACREOW_06435 [Thermodesulfobacteriota bacterium]